MLKTEAKHFTTYQVWIEAYTPCELSNWKKTDGEVFVSENCETSDCNFKHLERVRNLKNICFPQRVRIWNKILCNANLWVGKTERRGWEMKNIEFPAILNSISYNVSDFENKVTNWSKFGLKEYYCKRLRKYKVFLSVNYCCKVFQNVLDLNWSFHSVSDLE